MDGDSNGHGADELYGDSYLVILYLLLFLFLLGIVGYGVCCGLPSFFARYCYCSTGRCCGCIPIFGCRFDAAAYRHERQTLQRLRDIRRVQRQQQLDALRWATSQPGATTVDPAIIRRMNGTPNNIAILAAANNGRAAGTPMSPWSPVDIELRRMAYLQGLGGQAQGQQQQPHFPDRASMWATFKSLNSLGLIIVPQDQEEEEVHIRETLSSEERKAVLENMLDFTPYHSKDDDDEERENDMQSEAKSDEKESSLEEGNAASAENEAGTTKRRASVAFPAHEVPDVPETTCAICLDEFEEGDMLNAQDECPHLFHKDCLIMWLESHDICPICRREMVTSTQWREAYSHDVDSST